MRPVQPLPVRRGLAGDQTAIPHCRQLPAAGTLWDRRENAPRIWAALESLRGPRDRRCAVHPGSSRAELPSFPQSPRPSITGDTAAAPGSPRGRGTGSTDERRPPPSTGPPLGRGSPRCLRPAGRPEPQPSPPVRSGHGRGRCGRLGAAQPGSARHGPAHPPGSARPGSPLPPVASGPTPPRPRLRNLLLL